MERQQIIAEVKAQAEAEKELAIQETKKKKWVSLQDKYTCLIETVFTLVHFHDEMGLVCKHSLIA